MKKIFGLAWSLSVCLVSFAQVDTTAVYNPTTPFGALDIRIAKSATQYYYLQENITFSFRESAPGVKTNTFADMTSWDSSPYMQGNMREKTGAKDAFVMNYRLLFPKTYLPKTTYSDGYPLIVMMHGAGERGNCWDATCHHATRSWNPVTNNPLAPTTSTSELLNNDHNLVHGGGPHLDARNLAGTKLPNDPTIKSRAFPGFVLFPQNLNGWDAASVQNAIKLIRLAIKKYNIDPNRVYIHGLSNGGAATYMTIERAPWLFAAALPMSAISDGGIIADGMAPQIATIPLWTFQGGQDTSPSPGRTEGYLKKLKEAGVDVQYTLYPNLGHGTWNSAYSEPDFFSWILSKNKSNIHVFHNNQTICGTNGQGVKLGYSFGFRAYQWEFNGQTIEGATTAEYTATQPGIYRARFSRFENPTEQQWNSWSQSVTVSLSNPPQSTITVTGTTCMRGPDNNSAYNTIKLRSLYLNDHYYWYKNGVLIDIPSNTVDDTVRNYSITTSSSAASGVYTLITKSNGNCPTVVSEPLNLYFGNSALLLEDSNIPSNFQGLATSASEIDLSWIDNSNIESNVEIWRKKTGGIYTLAGKAGVNSTTFHDSGLAPLTAYNYKIRMVNSQGRSKYAPSDNISLNLVVTTLKDEIEPTAPQNLRVVSNSVSSIKLSWAAATDNTGVAQYYIYYGNESIATGSAETSFTLTGLLMNAAYPIEVKAVDMAGLFSSPSNQVIGTTHVSGLTYGHSTGAWTDLDLITWDTPEFTGQVPNFTLSPSTQEDFFYFQFNGYINITTGGLYEFRTTSDDGSRLALNNVVIVDNNGLHGNVTVTSTVQTLSSGTAYQINVKYLEYTGGQTLTVQYKGPDSGDTWVTIPDAVLNSGTNTLFAGSVSAKISPSESRKIEDLNSADFVFHAYPNPTMANNINIKLVTNKELPVQIQLTDAMGITWYNKSFSHEDANQGVKLSPETILNGMYIVTVSQGNRISKKKLLIKN